MTNVIETSRIPRSAIGLAFVLISDSTYLDTSFPVR